MSGIPQGGLGVCMGVRGLGVCLGFSLGVQGFARDLGLTV